VERHHHQRASHLGALPGGKGSVLVCQYSPNAYTLRHNGRMVRSDLTSIEDVCAFIDSLGVMRANALALLGPFRNVRYPVARGQRRICLSLLPRELQPSERHPTTAD
jgi:hypothetical protein